MIIGYDFLGFADEGTNGAYFDSPICVDMMDELQLNEGVYDEAYINVDTTTPNDIAKPTKWTLTTIMDAKFKGNLDAGSIVADGFKVTTLLLYRSIAESGVWDAICEFAYNPKYNLYEYVDRYIQNGTSYQYAIVPVANRVLGDKLESDVVQADYSGIFITDKENNRRLEYDISIGDIDYNNASSVSQPISGQFPIITFGNSNYRSGNMSVLPLSRETVAMGGGSIDKFAEQKNRQAWIDFLNNHKPKVIRMDNGTVMLVTTQNAKVTYKEGEILRDLANISFDYTEVGKINYENLVMYDLVNETYAHKSSYDDFGGIISG